MLKCERKGHEDIKAVLQTDCNFAQKVTDASKIFSLLGDESRMKIILALSKGELCVYHICEITGAKQSATSQHLRKLKDNNIVKSRKDGNLVLYSLADTHVSEIVNLTIEHLNCK